MPEKSPENYTWLTYAWVFGLSAMGGTVAFLRKVRDGHSRAWNFAELVGEVATSAFAGVMTFYLCEASSFSPLITAALVGVSGHMGSRSIFQLENFFSSKFPAQRKEEEGS